VHPNWLPGPSRRPRRSEHEGGSLGQEALCRHRALWKNPGRPGTGTHWSRGRHSHEDLGHAGELDWVFIQGEILIEP